VLDKLVTAILNLSRPKKRAVALAVDGLLCLLTVGLAYYLRLGFWSWPVNTQWLSYAAATLFSLPLFVTFGFYRAIFRYAGWGALMAVVRACGVYGVIYSAVFTGVGVFGVPRTVGLIQPVLMFLAIGGSRALARYWLGGGYAQIRRLGQRPRVMIYGAGSAGRQLAAALGSSEEMQIIGFIDDDKTLQGSVLNGKTIYGSFDLTDLLKRLQIADILLAIPSASRSRRNEILELVRGTPVGIRTLPDFSAVASGKITVNDLRELDIEDLLGRDSVAPNQVLLSKNITGKTVLVSGAGGSIGSELCRQIIRLKPAALLLVEMSEFSLYAVHQELQSKLLSEEEAEFPLIPLLGSVCDDSRMRAIMQSWKPETVYHAAAYKHVPLVEHNPAEGVRNNVFGTLRMARIAKDCGVHDFVLISTDKAVRPTSVMGTTKRLAEMVLQALAAEGSKTRFVMVRFGNVLGSSGSVVPLFRKQIKLGGPITITHEEITRYFMTIPEAAQLVIQAGAMATGGEVFVLDMGDPVRIVDLARNMIELSGLKVRDVEHPDGDIELEFVGLRPGEKLYEELIIGDGASATNHSGIMKANEEFLIWSEILPHLERLGTAVDNNDPVEIRTILRILVGDYQPERQVVDHIFMQDAAA
jgi:FlaA1/EpsC-like NDP-sugar epimerase